MELFSRARSTSIEIMRCTDRGQEGGKCVETGETGERGNCILCLGLTGSISDIVNDTVLLQL